MIPYLITNWRLVLSIIALFVLTVFMGIRTCNQISEEIKNEIIPIEDITVKPSDANANCLRLTGKPCPTNGK